MTVRVADVGKKIKCPDCGRRNVIPKPPRVVVPKPLAAMSGGQYAMWGVGEAAGVVHGAVNSQTLHPVECGLCGTLMYATDAQVGKKSKCPDCGTLTLVQSRTVAKPRGPVLVPAGEEYQLDPSQAPAPRPAPNYVVTVRAADVSPLARSSTVGPDGRLVHTVTISPPDERPKMPAVPLVQGVLPMLLTQEVIARWVAQSIVLGFVLQLAAESLFSPLQGMAEAIKIVMAAVGAIAGALWIMMAAPFFVAMIAESSDGNKQLNEPPGLLAFDCFGEALSVVMAGSAAGLFGLLAWTLSAPLGLPAQLGFAVAAVLLILPIGLLSTLLEGSPFAVASPRMFASMVRCMGPWLLFYLESAMLASLVGLTAWLLRESQEGIAWGLAPVAMGAALVYARLLGRLGWWISEIMPPAEDDAEPHRQSRA